MNIRISILTVMISVFAWSVYGANPAPIPPTISASAKAQVDIKVEELPPSAPLADIIGKIKIAHSISLTPEQEAALQSDAVIYISGIEFSPSEDPKFQNGDKSVSITKTVPTGLIPIPSEVVIKSKWGKGKMTTSININQKVKDLNIAPLAVTPEDFAKILNLQKKEITLGSAKPRYEYNVVVFTKIEHPSITTLAVESYMAADVMINQYQGATAEGTQLQGTSQKIQTKYYAAP